MKLIEGNLLRIVLCAMFLMAHLQVVAAKNADAEKENVNVQRVAGQNETVRHKALMKTGKDHEVLPAGQSDASRTVTAPVIFDKPVRLTEFRQQLMKEYALRHYGEEMMEIVPRVVIVHWTESPDWQGVYQYFYKETRSDGTLNVCSQFLVDRDGTIFRLTPETMLDRHAIGYNWCAIGIENVGGVNNAEDLTEAQLQSNLLLIRYLQEKYPTITYMWGHYQQIEAKKSGLYKEAVPGYFNPKVDPGPRFMKALQQNLKDAGLQFYKP